MALPPGFVDELEDALGAGFVITEPEKLATYDCDGLTGWRAQPACVVLPGSAAEVQAVLRLCARDGVPFVARGAGTGLSGGALPVADGVVVSLSRMNRIVEIDLESERVIVEPGVANLDVTRAVAGEGYFYAPDPSSQQVCTIGGNLAENSGGAHCLKHGFTVNHVTGAKVVLADGELLELGGKSIDGDDGPDLLGVIVGSEGTLGVAVEITLRVVRQPEVVVTQLAAFSSIDAAGDAVSRVVAAGIVPAAMEIMDSVTLEAAEAAYAPGYPEGARAVLLVELDGVAAQVALDTEESTRSAAPPGRSRSARRATRTSARASGWAERARSRRWVASRPTTTSRTASSLAPGCRRSSGASTSSPPSTACGSGTSSMRATATSIRSCSTTAPRRARSSARRRSRTRSSPRASRRAAR